MPTKRNATLKGSVAIYTGFETWVGNTRFADSSGAPVKMNWGEGKFTIGFSHPEFFSKKVKGDKGGPFTTSTSEVTLYPQKVTAYSVYPPVGTHFRFSSKDAVLVETHGIPNPGTSVPIELIDSTLIARGVQAWAMVKPTASEGGLGQAVGELRQLPTLPKIKELRDAMSKAPSFNSARKIAKETGGNYLNIVFGWAPLVKDVKDLIENVREFDKNFQQLHRNNGKGVRRRKGLDGGQTTNSVVTTGTWGVTSPPGCTLFPFFTPAMFSNPTWTLTTTTVVTWDYRFSARFRYYLPTDAYKQGKLYAFLQMNRILFGADVSPATVYELMPWSWLIDWVVPVGSNLSNLRDFEDRLVADYAYINGCKTTEVTRTLQCSLKGDTGGARTFVWKRKDRMFRRIAASPFGFGITLSALSPEKKAILAALGLTKLL